jgi:hypothetical protein
MGTREGPIRVDKESMLRYGGMDPIPGAKVQIQQMPTIRDAEASEGRIISWNKPPHNEQGK